MTELRCGVMNCCDETVKDASVAVTVALDSCRSMAVAWIGKSGGDCGAFSSLSILGHCGSATQSGLNDQHSTL